MTERNGGPGGSEDGGHPARRVSDDTDRERAEGPTRGDPRQADRAGAENVADREASRSGDDGDGGRGSWLVHVYDMVTSAGGVLLVGLLIVAVSGVWPPLVAIESGSMEPHIQQGDLVFVMDEQRFPGPGAKVGTGVVTANEGERTGYHTFDGPGDVIVFQPGGSDSATPVIHRAMFWVSAGENWFNRADSRYLGTAEDCSELDHCPAPHGGFVTKGDSNTAYDQASSGSEWAPVKPEWVIGTAEHRLPAVGRLRLGARGALGTGTAGETGGSAGDPMAATCSMAAGA